jgi:hypothetical protein
MSVFGTGLTWEQHQFFGTIAVVVDIGHQLQPELLQLPQVEIDDFNITTFLWRQDNSSPSQHFHRTLSRSRFLLLS